jgi:hypothetical protein
MPNSRRDFLKYSTLTASTLPLLFPALSDLDEDTIDALLMRQRGQSSAQDKVDKQTLDFWISKVRQPSDDFANGLIPKSNAPFSDVPEFVYYDAKDGFKLAASLDESTLPDKGSVKIAFQVQGFRPSKANIDKFNDLRSGSLRVDVKQTAPLPGLAEALAWTAVAAMLPTAEGKLPALENLGFKPGESWGKLQQIPLTNGLGFWSWNFFLKKKESIWGKLMKAFDVANKQVFPPLGLPAIAVTALTAVDRFVGYLQAQDASNWIFKSVENAVYATKEAKDMVGNGIALRDGDYIVVPRNQLSEFGKQASSMMMQRGYVVRKGTKDFDIYVNALNEIPAIDYISIKVRVEKA